VSRCPRRQDTQTEPQGQKGTEAQGRVEGDGYVSNDSRRAVHGRASHDCREREQVEKEDEEDEDEDDSSAAICPGLKKKRKGTSLNKLFFASETSTFLMGKTAAVT